MTTASASGEPLFVLPDGSPLPRQAWPGGSEQNKTRPRPLEERSGGFGLKKNETLGEFTIAGQSQVGSPIGGNAGPSGAVLGEGERGERSSSTSSLGGQARSARPALGQCERYDCSEPASEIKTLYCGYRAEYCADHARTEW